MKLIGQMDFDMPFHVWSVVKAITGLMFYKQGENNLWEGGDPQWINLVHAFYSELVTNPAAKNELQFVERKLTTSTLKRHLLNAGLPHEQQLLHRREISCVSLSWRNFPFRDYPNKEETDRAISLTVSGHENPISVFKPYREDDLLSRYLANWILKNSSMNPVPDSTILRKFEYTKIPSYPAFTVLSALGIEYSNENIILSCSSVQQLQSIWIDTKGAHLALGTIVIAGIKNRYNKMHEENNNNFCLSFLHCRFFIHLFFSL